VRESARATATTPKTQAAIDTPFLSVARSPSRATASASVNSDDAVERIVLDVTEVRARDALNESCAPNQSGATQRAASATERSSGERQKKQVFLLPASAGVVASGRSLERKASRQARSLLLRGEKSGRGGGGGEEMEIGVGGGAAGGSGEGRGKRPPLPPSSLLFSSPRGPSRGLGTSGNEASSASSESLRAPPLLVLKIREREEKRCERLRATKSEKTRKRGNKVQIRRRKTNSQLVQRHPIRLARSPALFPFPPPPGAEAAVKRQIQHEQRVRYVSEGQRG